MKISERESFEESLACREQNLLDRIGDIEIGGLRGSGALSGLLMKMISCLPASLPPFEKDKQRVTISL